MSECKTIEGDYTARGARFGIVLSRFNHFIGDRLLEGALDSLVRHGVDGAAIEVVAARVIVVNVENDFNRLKALGGVHHAGKKTRHQFGPTAGWQQQ